MLYFKRYFIYYILLFEPLYFFFKNKDCSLCGFGTQYTHRRSKSTKTIQKNIYIYSHQVFRLLTPKDYGKFIHYTPTYHSIRDDSVPLRLFWRTF